MSKACCRQKAMEVLDSTACPQARLDADIKLSLDEVRDFLRSLQQNQLQHAADFENMASAIKSLQAAAVNDSFLELRILWINVYGGLYWGFPLYGSYICILCRMQSICCILRMYGQYISVISSAGLSSRVPPLHDPCCLLIHNYSSQEWKVQTQVVCNSPLARSLNEHIRPNGQMLTISGEGLV